MIIGVEIASPHSGADSPDSYYLNLILDRVYWRIHLDSDGRYDTAVKLAKLISQFLEVNYFPDESKAPLRVWERKSLEGAVPYQFYWKYFEEEIDRLQQHLSQHPSDADAHQLSLIPETIPDIIIRFPLSFFLIKANYSTVTLLARFRG